MAQTAAKENTTEKVEVKRPRNYKVIIWNDDFTPMDFVTDILKTIFGMDPASAFSMMMKVHQTGSSVAGIYTLDIAQTKAHKAMSLARSHEYPLTLTVEEN